MKRKRTRKVVIPPEVLAAAEQLHREGRLESFLAELALKHAVARRLGAMIEREVARAERLLPPLIAETLDSTHEGRHHAGRFAAAL